MFFESQKPRSIATVVIEFENAIAVFSSLDVSQYDAFHTAGFRGGAGTLLSNSRQAAL
jgi:hypothetical protein